MNRRDEIAANLAEVERAIANACAEASRSRDEITLIAVTKTFPVEDVQILYDLGIRNFGENRDQEGSAKAPALPSDAIWHFQGHIQSKKIKSIVQWAQWIHSVDDLEHAKKIAERSPGHRVLVQVDLEKSSGEKRGGVQLPDLPTFIQNLGNVRCAPGDQPLGCVFGFRASVSRDEKGLSRPHKSLSWDEWRFR